MIITNIALGLIGIALTIFSIVLAYIWKLNGRLQKAIIEGLSKLESMIVDGLSKLEEGHKALREEQKTLIEDQKALMERQKAIAKILERIEGETQMILKQRYKEVPKNFYLTN
jgi:DNA repair exonuclease SbcCD ATPase subunit